MFGLARTSAMGWLALATGLVGIVAVEVAGPATSAGPVADKAIDRVEVDDTIPRIVARSAPATVDDILERPLFSADRKPNGVIGQESSLQLIGTMVDADAPSDGAGVAILKHPGQGRVLRRVGETIDDWTIVVVETSRIALRRDDDITHLQLQRGLTRQIVTEDTVDTSEANAPSAKEEDGSPDDEKPHRMSMEELEALADEAALKAWLERSSKDGE